MMSSVLDRFDRVHIPLPRRMPQVTGDLAQRQCCPATLREIGDAVGPSGVSHQLSTVRSGGDLQCEVERLCTVEVRQLGHPTDDLEAEDSVDAPEISSQDAAYVGVPVVGQIRAGDLNAAEQIFEDTFRLPKQIVGEGTLFMLKVVGDSMINAAIGDGNWVVVRQQSVAENGEIVAAMIDGEATIKSLQQAGGHVWLMPHNPQYSPILGDEATILGKVIAVVRQV